MKPFRFLRSPITQALAQRRLLSCAVFSSFALLAAPQAGAVMMDIGNLPGGGSLENLVISGDGQVVAGTTGVSADQLFYWSADKGFTSMGSAFTTKANVYGASKDGSVIVGRAGPLAGSPDVRAFRWTAASGFTDLGTLGGTFSEARGVSANGNVVVGVSANASNIASAFRWEGGTMKELSGLQPGQVSSANAVSGNGKVTVGQSGPADAGHSVLWDEHGNITDLGQGPVSSWASSVNFDGSVVVGTEHDGSGYQAYRWTASGGKQNIGTLAGKGSNANDVNADGSVVVGSSQQSDGADRAFRWTQATGMTNLGVLSGTTSSYATGVSDDGKTVVGTSGTRGFIWKADAPAMQDLQNLQLSQITSAATLGQLTAAQNRRLRDLNQQQCIPTDAQQYCLSSGLSTYRGEATRSGNQVIGQATGGVRINEQFAVGASLNLGQADLKTASAEQNNAYGLALWGRYQQQPDALGWVGSASIGMGHSRDSFERGAGLTDVQRAQARTEMSSTSVRVAVGYGMQMGKSRVTPEVALSHTRSNSDGFTERNVAFPLTLNATRSDETYATFGVRSETPLTPKTTLHLGAAVDALLNDNSDAIEGSSSVPGLGRFQLRSNLDKRDLLPVANAGVSYAVSPNSSVSGQVQVGAATHKQESAVYGVGVQYRYAF